MKSIVDDLLKYWPILSAIAVGTFLVIGWCIRLEMKTNETTVLAQESDATIDKLTKKVDRLDTIEELREKGLCK
jgi:outer membrane murein-binding lipoprotein Lpp